MRLKASPKFKILIAALLFSFSANASFAQSQPAQAEAVSLNSAVAFVAGQAITEQDLVFASEDLTQELSQIPPAERRAFLISVLIDMKVMAGAAKEAKMDKSETYAARLQYLEDRALRRAYFTDVIGVRITPQTVQKSYDEMVAQYTPVQEWRARHILVSSEEDAKKIKIEIDNGKLFDIAALEYSMDDRSGRNGGDLGYFRHKDMTALFEEAAIALEVGQVSDPVKTEFGWHIIKLEDDRMSQAPSFDQVQGQIAQQQLIDNFNETIKSLKENTEIEVVDPAIAEQILAQEPK